MTDKDPIFKVLVKLETCGVQTPFQLLIIDDRVYGASISAPSLLMAIHWRGADIGKAVSRMTSEATRLVEYLVIEITPRQALDEHLTICKNCPQGKYCFPGNQLRERLQELEQATYSI